jgi:hypothetical protein
VQCSTGAAACTLPFVISVVFGSSSFLTLVVRTFRHRHSHTANRTNSGDLWEANRYSVSPRFFHFFRIFECRFFCSQQPNTGPSPELRQIQSMTDFSFLQRYGLGIYCSNHTNTCTIYFFIIYTRLHVSTLLGHHQGVIDYQRLQIKMRKYE